jgi:hypothetical protein
LKRTYYGWTFDGEALWLSDGYTPGIIQIAEGNAYESSSVEVEVTVTDPSGNTSVLLMLLLEATLLQVLHQPT